MNEPNSQLRFGGINLWSTDLEGRGDGRDYLVHRLKSGAEKKKRKQELHVVKQVGQIDTGGHGTLCIFSRVKSGAMAKKLLPEDSEIKA